MKKPGMIRAYVILAIMAGAMTFQNCGPTFLTNEQGQTVMSSFEGMNDVLPVAASPSQVARVLPTGPLPGNNKALFRATNTSTNVAQASNCGSQLLSQCLNYGVTFVKP
jgi:hypothetical protein